MSLFSGDCTGPKYTLAVEQLTASLASLSEVSVGAGELVVASLFISQGREMEGSKTCAGVKGLAGSVLNIDQLARWPFTRPRPTGSSTQVASHVTSALHHLTITIKICFPSNTKVSCIIRGRYLQRIHYKSSRIKIQSTLATPPKCCYTRDHKTMLHAMLTNDKSMREGPGIQTRITRMMGVPLQGQRAFTKGDASTSIVEVRSGEGSRRADVIDATQ